MKRIPANLNSLTFSIKHLFLLAAMAGGFLACFRWSAPLAMLLMLILGPAVIRAMMTFEQQQRAGNSLNQRQQVVVLAASAAIVCLAYVAAVAGFILTTLLFGGCAALFGVGVGLGDVWFDSFVFGSLAGMTLGMAGAFVAAGGCLLRTWTYPDSIIAPTRRTIDP